MHTQSRGGGSRRFAVLLAAVALAWNCGTARADWAQPPTLSQLANYLDKVDSVVVWSVELPESAAARSKREVEVLDVAKLRGSASTSRDWARRFVQELTSKVPRDSMCDCALVRRADDTTAIVPVVQIHIDQEIVTVLFAFREDCARVFLPQGTWGGLPITANRDRLWSLLREALLGDPAFNARSAAPAFVPKPAARYLPGPTGSASKAAYLRPMQGFHGASLFVEELPEAVKRVPPSYPEQARDRGVQGTVLVRALVGTNGAVQETWVSWTQRGLDEAAVDAVRQWQFKPARLDGKPIPVWVVLPVKFTLH